MARKNKGLPFIVQPRLKPVVEVIGSELSGQIEIERRGYLTVAEKTIVQNAMNQSPYMKEAFAKAREIASVEKMSVQQVFSDLSLDPQPEYLGNYPEVLADIMAAMLGHEEKLRLIAATTLILTRVNPNWDPEETVSLHPDMQSALYDLYKDEEARSVEALEEASEVASKASPGTEGKDQAQTVAD